MLCISLTILERPFDNPNHHASSTSPQTGQLNANRKPGKWHIIEIEVKIYTVSPSPSSVGSGPSSYGPPRISLDAKFWKPGVTYWIGRV